MDLYNSRWASRKPQGQYSASTTAATRNGVSQTPADEYSKHTKLLRRLKWKSHLLVSSHQRVTRAMQAPAPQAYDVTATEAETMFKLDFFEFYVLLERVLLHLLGVFSISISAQAAPDAAVTKGDVSSTGTPIIGSSNYTRTYYNHRFHANVLQALDQPANPLHAVLGTGDARRYLSIAKESRNKWKDAEEEQPGLPLSSAWQGSADVDPSVLRHQRMLKNVDLEAMLASILDALDKAGVIAEEQVVKGQHGANGAAGPVEQGVTMEYDMEDAPLEAMPDAMEWEEF